MEQVKGGVESTKGTFRTALINTASAYWKMQAQYFIRAHHLCNVGYARQAVVAGSCIAKEVLYGP